MDIELLRDYCLQKPDTTEELPFGPDVVVFKVRGKAFLLLSLDTEDLQFNVKCDPDRAVELREEYSCVQPGYHMNKKHWNTIIVDGTLNTKQIKQMIDHSYELVVNSLSKKVKRT
ncbi:MAG: MmcQ/YjbR family DNA-binding protein [Sphingobacteriales bacterium]|nr:MmcQ/YjbR family DNA-binding protein [Sphingobacteriales bacterium]MBI3719017.1 MmcQ/YjbR family DNA-binding protein [Sphingobacteriales bacterium]